MMSKSLPILLFLGLSCLLDSTFAQENFNYRIPISQVSGSHARIVIPTIVWKHSSLSLSDLRVFAVSDTDTIEAPYVIFNSQPFTEYNRIISQ